ncbi:hypothetical protein LV779_07915 [Streptomyces thinghirensis]|nr:hypothetical protein [Streptomyces thinghirensis]
MWKLLSDAEPEWLADQVDFRYIEDALTREEAVALLRRGQGRCRRARGPPPGERLPGVHHLPRLARLLRREAWSGSPSRRVADGFTQIKLKVGADLADDVRRLRAARAAVGPDVRIAVDANQRWNVAEAVEWTNALADQAPYWVEEPTSPDDILGHATVRRGVAPVKVATGEHVHNRIVFANSCRPRRSTCCRSTRQGVGGVNENLAILLLAAKYGVPVCPHAGGVGLCELVRHLSMFDYVALSGTSEDRVIEYVDHLHEHSRTPSTVANGHYRAPTTPGFSSEMHAASIAAHRYPDGSFWVSDATGCAERRKGTNR